MFADYHVHTAFSDDSLYPMERVVQDAIGQGIEEICFTDHVDYGVKVDWDSGQRVVYRQGEPMANVNYPRYVREIQRLREIYGKRITLRMGMEFGMQVHTIPAFEALYRRYPFDFIILSVHQVEDQEFWTQDFQRGRTRQEYQERYYKEMLCLVRRFHNYSVLGHMDLINRYDLVGGYPFEKIKPYVEKILREVIQDGKGLEVNTSSRRYQLKDTTPSGEILKLYRALGGEILTIGSDSHRPEHLGVAIQETRAHLKSLGFQSFCTYENMRPVFHPL